MNIRRFLHTIFFSKHPSGRWGLGFRFEGLTGEAKTAMIGAEARACGLKLFELNAGVMAPEDFNGLPFRTERGVEYSPDQRLVAAAAAGRAVVFFDEVNLATPATQGAMLKGILQGQFGTCQLPPGVRMVAAHNPVGVAAGGWDLADPIKTRWGFAKWPEVEVDDFVQHLLTSGDDDYADAPATLDPAQEEARVEAAWSAARSRARGLVAAYLRSRPTHLRQHPKAGAVAPESWANPRVWKNVSAFMAGAEIHALDDVTADVGLSGYLGEGVAGEFAEFCRKLDLPDPVEILDGEATFKHEPKRADRTAAVIGSLVGVLVAEKCEARSERARRFWKIAGEVATQAGDLAVLGANTILHADNKRLFPQLIGSKEYNATMAALEPITKAAKIGQGASK